MVIFLDCDGTLFDSRAFLAYMDEHGGDLVELLADDAAAPFSRWLYPDVVTFCDDAREAGHKVVILSSAGNVEGQHQKILATGIAAHVDDIIVTPGCKSITLGAWLELHNEQKSGHYFVDDMPPFLNEVKRAHPGIRCVRIEREAVPSAVEFFSGVDLTDRVVTSLDELRPLLLPPLPPAIAKSGNSPE